MKTNSHYIHVKGALYKLLSKKFKLPINFCFIFIKILILWILVCVVQILMARFLVREQIKPEIWEFAFNKSPSM